MDEDTLDSVLESCSAEEIDIINGILEAVSEKDKAILSRGYKVGDGTRPIKDAEKAGVQLDFFKPAEQRFFDKKNLKNISGDLKVDAVRIKNNLMGNAKEVSDIMKENERKKISKEHDDELVRHPEIFQDKPIMNFNELQKKSDKAKEKVLQKYDKRSDRMLYEGSLSAKAAPLVAGVSKGATRVSNNVKSAVGKIASAAQKVTSKPNTNSQPAGDK